MLIHLFAHVIHLWPHAGHCVHLVRLPRSIEPGGPIRPA